MNDPKASPHFVKGLMAQDSLLDDGTLEVRRARFRERLARAERVERAGRRITMVAAVVGLGGFVAMYAFAVEAVGNAQTWPEWLKMLAAVTTICLPVIVVLLASVYFFRHRRELLLAQRESQRQTLVEMQRQIDELKRRLPMTGESPEPTRQKRQAGFTLVEALVVVAILGVLAALLLPALGHARNRARSTVCQNNLGQLGRALAMYAGEFHRYPGTRSSPIRPGSSFLKESARAGASLEWVLWDERLAPYFAARSSVLRCPSHDPTVFAGTHTNYSYGYNAYGSGVMGPRQNLGLGRVLPPDDYSGPSPMMEVSDAKVRVPSDMVAVADVEDVGSHYSTAVVTPGQALASPTARHAGGANAVFCDGHVEFAKQSRWTEKTSAARRRWNNDHEPHPETW